MTKNPHTPEKSYRHIIAQEQTLARAVADSAIRPRPFTVWEVIIPVLLIINFMKTRGDREIFVKNLLFTKELALRAALEMAESEKTKRNAMTPIEEKTRDLLATVGQDLYSEDIRRCQVQEMDYLVDHYYRLLTAEGENFPALVRAAYPDYDGYLAFLQRLGDLEKQVNGAALRTLGSRGDPALVSRMEEAVYGLRRASAKRIFRSEG